MPLPKQLMEKHRKQRTDFLSDVNYCSMQNKRDPNTYEVRDKSGRVIGRMTMVEFTKWAGGNRATLKNYTLN